MNIFIDETGKKVKLKNMRVSQVKQMTQWGSHKDRLFADYDFPKFENDEIIQWFKVKSTGNRAIVAITDFYGEVVGYISLRKIRTFFKTAEFGVVLNPDKIENGYGTDALNILAKWFFNKLKYKKLYLTVAKYNDRAYRIYKKMGFEALKFTEESFDNYEINPLSDDKYKSISKYFTVKRGGIFVSCIKMQLTREKFEESKYLKNYI